jgi:hypothetical protein
VIGILASLLLTMQSASSMAESTPKPIANGALRTLLRDVYVAPVPLPGGTRVDHPPGEIFGSNGVYRRALSRRSIEGTFVIQGDLVCVQGPDLHRLCRQVLGENNGTYVFIDVETGSSTLMTVTPLP